MIIYVCSYLVRTARKEIFMNDKLYLPDNIPSDYHYAIFGNYYVTLYNKPSAQGETLDYYRIYFNYSPGLYTSGTTTFSSYNRTYFDNIPVSKDWFDRPDILNIVGVVFICSILGLFVINLFTSFFKKGGFLSGLI